MLDETCGPADTEVRREVERMLAADRTCAELDEPLARVPRLADAATDAVRAVVEGAPRPGTRVGGFEIVAVLGEGGMATVYRAEQGEPHRTVALKMRRGDLGSAAGLRRFRYETEVLAALRHPGIAQLYEAGTHWRRVGDRWLQEPWVAMELVEGARDLVAYAHAEELGLAARLRLFAEVTLPRSRTPSRGRTATGSCTATSSRRTCSSTARDARASSTSASRAPSIRPRSSA